MLKTPRVGAAFLTLSCLLGCSAPKPAVTAAPKPRGPSFSLDTPLYQIDRDPGGKALLHRDLPHLMSSSKYILFEDMSLTQIASMSGGRLTAAKLEQVELDLAQLSHTETGTP
jgi:hypothetical protein